MKSEREEVNFNRSEIEMHKTFLSTNVIKCFSIFLIFFLSGCAKLNSIHRAQKFDNLNNVNILTVDAKQRHLLIAPEFDSSKKNKFRICAEAAPDVFSAYASSMAANLGLGATERNAKFANSIAETAATAERTQTINLLRESMYRACERYLSGALTEDQFIIQAARDQRSMVAVLAIEQLTGAIRAKPTIITGPATSASVIDGAEAAKLIERFRIEEETAKKNLTEADKAYTAAKKAGKCDSITEKPAADAKDPTADEWAACKMAETLLAQRKEELKAATGRLDKALTLAADFVSKSSASTTAGTNSGEAHTGKEPGDAAVIAISMAVESIATSTVINEPLMFCIAYLQRNRSLDESVSKVCTQIISEQAKNDLIRQEIRLGITDAGGLGIANVGAYRQAIDQSRRLNEFMRMLFKAIDKTDPKTLAKKMAAFETMAGTNHGLGVACTDLDACKKAVSASDLSESFIADEKKMETTLQSWDKL
ncbi:MAG: hypothetical protein ABL934_12475 [Lysobacteraceae bacterium]